MSTPYNRQYTRIPMPGSDLPGINLTASAIPAFTVVSVDTTAANQVPLVDGYSIVTTPTAAGPNSYFGVTIDQAYPATTSNSGQTEQAMAATVATAGVVWVTLDGTVTAGGYVDASTTTAGHVKAHTTAKPHMGQALMDGLDQDQIQILLTPAGAPNA